MPIVETPFIIAVIREKEKTLLGDDEINRIMHATSLADAREVLMSTPYAIFLTETVSIQQAISTALGAEFAWLKESLDNKKVLEFIAARYDTLHIAQGILALESGLSYVPHTSSIGTLSHEAIQGMVFTENYPVSHEMLFWIEKVRAQKDARKRGVWSMPFLFDSMQHALEERLEYLAFTPLMRSIAKYVRDRHASDTELRKNTVLTDATQYELGWDGKAISLVRDFRFEPTGYDPIIAYWITKEMEVKTINLIFAALSGGFNKEETVALIRPFAHV